MNNGSKVTLTYTPGHDGYQGLSSFEALIPRVFNLPTDHANGPGALEDGVQENLNACRQLMWHLMRNEAATMTPKLTEAIDRWWDAAMNTERTDEHYVAFVEAAKRVCNILAPLETLSLRKALLQTDEEFEQQEREYSQARKKRQAAAHAASA